MGVNTSIGYFLVGCQRAVSKDGLTLNLSIVKTSTGDAATAGVSGTATSGVAWLVVVLVVLVEIVLLVVAVILVVIVLIVVVVPKQAQGGF